MSLFKVVSFALVKVLKTFNALAPKNDSKESIAFDNEELVNELNKAHDYLNSRVVDMLAKEIESSHLFPVPDDGKDGLIGVASNNFSRKDVSSNLSKEEVLHDLQTLVDCNNSLSSFRSKKVQPKEDVEPETNKPTTKKSLKKSSKPLKKSVKSTKKAK